MYPIRIPRLVCKESILPIKSHFIHFKDVNNMILFLIVLFIKIHPIKFNTMYIQDLCILFLVWVESETRRQGCHIWWTGCRGVREGRGWPKEGSRSHQLLATGNPYSPTSKSTGSPRSKAKTQRTKGRKWKKTVWKQNASIPHSRW